MLVKDELLDKVVARDQGADAGGSGTAGRGVRASVLRLGRRRTTWRTAPR